MRRTGSAMLPHLCGQLHSYDTPRAPALPAHCCSPLFPAEKKRLGIPGNRRSLNGIDKGSAQEPASLCAVDNVAEYAGDEMKPEPFLYVLPEPPGEQPAARRFCRGYPSDAPVSFTGLVTISWILRSICVLSPRNLMPYRKSRSEYCLRHITTPATGRTPSSIKS